MEYELQVFGVAFVKSVKKTQVQCRYDVRVRFVAYALLPPGDIGNTAYLSEVMLE